METTPTTASRASFRAVMVMRLLFATVLVFAAACGGSGAAATTTPTQVELAPAQVLREVGGAVEQYRQGYVVRSAQAITPLYAKDAVVVNQGRAHRGQSAVDAYVTDLLARASEVQIQLTNLDIVALGSDGARAVATLVRTISDGVTTVEEKGTITLTFRREPAGAWLIVSEHCSYRPGQ